MCRAWADDGCPHIGEDGELLAEFRAEAEAIELAALQAEEELIREIEDGERLAEEWRRMEGRR